MTPRTDPPLNASELETLRGYLDYHRATLRLKAAGLDGARLARCLEPSSLSLGGLLKHMSLVEHTWFRYRLAGGEQIEPWTSVDWAADPDWDFRSAAGDSPAQLLAGLDAAIADSDAAIEEVLAGGGGLETVLRREVRGDRPSMRWLLLHMIEEYARHNGHADLIRESIDGQVGE